MTKAMALVLGLLVMHESAASDLSTFNVEFEQWTADIEARRSEWEVKETPSIKLRRLTKESAGLSKHDRKEIIFAGHEMEREAKDNRWIEEVCEVIRSKPALDDTDAETIVAISAQGNDRYDEISTRYLRHLERKLSSQGKKKLAEVMATEVELGFDVAAFARINPMFWANHMKSHCSPQPQNDAKDPVVLQ